MSRIGLLLIGDGRDEVHERSWASAKKNLPPIFEEPYVRINDADHKLGFAGAIQAGWDQVLELDLDFVLHLELDFLFRERVPIDRMVNVLERHPEIAQIVLKRQPCNAEEAVAGGIVEAHPDDFEEHYDGLNYWVTHRRYWSTNPGIYSTRYCRIGWPQARHSEGLFTHKLLADPMLHFAIWGRKFDPPRVEHIGERVGVGY